MDDMGETFLERERQFKRHPGNALKYLVEVLHCVAYGLEQQYCHSYPDFLDAGKGYAYEFPLTITVKAMYDGPCTKYRAEVSAKGHLLGERISIPVLKTIEEIACEESQ